MYFIRPAALATFALAVLGAPAAAVATCADMVTAPQVLPVAGVLTDVIFDQQCRYVFAANTSTNRVDVFSLTTGALAASIPVGFTPTALDLSPDGTALYVANAGNAGNTGISDSSISVIDTVTLTETRRAAIAPAFEKVSPQSLAVAKSGKVLFTGFWGVTGPGGGLFEMDSRSGTITQRKDAGDLGPNLRLKASGDGSVIVLIVSDDRTTKYSSATDSFGAPKPTAMTMTDVALNGDGSRGLLLTGDGLVTIDANLNQRLLPGGVWNVRGMVADPAGKSGFVPGPSGGIRVIDLAAAAWKAGVIPTDDTLAHAGRMAISRDGTMLALISDQGLSLLPATDPAPPGLHIVASSSTDPDSQSFLRFYNAAVPFGGVHVTLADLATGKVLVEWDSPGIPRHAAPQFGIAEIEAQASQPFVRPERYMVSITAPGAMQGSFSYVLWHSATGSITNLSTCDGGAPITPLPSNSAHAPPPASPASLRAVNVHSSILDYGYPSYIGITNDSGMTASPTVSIYDGRTGTGIGWAQLPDIPGGGGRVYSVAELERLMSIRPSESTFHYTVEITNHFPGHMQHLVENKQAGVLTDMTATCALVEP